MRDHKERQYRTMSDQSQIPMGSACNNLFHCRIEPLKSLVSAFISKDELGGT